MQLGIQGRLVATRISSSFSSMNLIILNMYSFSFFSSSVVVPLLLLWLWWSFLRLESWLLMMLIVSDIMNMGNCSKSRTRALRNWDPRSRFPYPISESPSTKDPKPYSLNPPQTLNPDIRIPPPRSSTPLLAQALRFLAPVAAPLGDWALVIGRGEHLAAERIHSIMQYNIR